MKILVMSDSHGWDYNAAEAVRREKTMDALIHLGDAQETMAQFLRGSGVRCPAYMVEGNCDMNGYFPREQIVELGGHRLLLTHGHDFYVRFGTEELHDEAIRNQCDIALFGHTHKPLLEETDPAVLILNPGSISSPRQENGRPSYLVLELEADRRPVAELRYL